MADHPQEPDLAGDPPGRSYTASVPLRYGENYPTYLVRDGWMRLDDQERHAEPTDDWSQVYGLGLVIDQLLKEGVAGDVAIFSEDLERPASFLAPVAKRMNATLYLTDVYTPHPIAPYRRGSQTVNVPGDGRVVRGDLGVTSARLPQDSRFAIVYIHTAPYLSCRDAIRFFWPHLMPGGVLIVASYANMGGDSAEKAVDEFFADKPEVIVPLADRAGTAVVRKIRNGGVGSNWFAHRQAALATDRWVGARYSALLTFLSGGWSPVEDEAVWGVEGRHTLTLYFAEAPQDDVELLADVSAVIAGTQREQRVGVSVGDHPLSVWSFTTLRNRSLRAVRIPKERIVRDGSTYLVDVTFTPESLKSPHDLDPALSEDRVLGMRLHRFRQRVIGNDPEGDWVRVNGDSPRVDMLVSGWSDLEGWGLWGLGASHTISLQVSTFGPDDRLVLDVEARAPVFGTRPRMKVDVVAGGHVLSTWWFSTEKSDGILSVEIPATIRSLPSLLVEFRPSPVASPREMDPAVADDRQLGMGLTRLRLRRSD